MRACTLLMLVILLLGLSACKSSVFNRCPLVPLRLVVEMPEVGKSMILEIDDQGLLTSGLKPGEPIARFDSRGCLIGEDGAWVELTRDGKLWTQRGLLTVDGADLLLGKRRLRITEKGKVVGVDEKGQLEPDVDDLRTDLRFEDYSPQARCVALVMLAAHTSMMPSMAVVDGVAELLPPPEGSICQN